MTIPEEATIRAMDGKTLTGLAWAIGLAPTRVEPLPGQEASFGLFLYDSPRRLNYTLLELWQPHADLAQADAVFRQLRALGWDTHVQYFVEEGRGKVWALQQTGESSGHGSVVPWQRETGEAEALLRCACLALASERQKEHPDD